MIGAEKQRQWQKKVSVTSQTQRRIHTRRWNISKNFTWLDHSKSQKNCLTKIMFFLELVGIKLESYPGSDEGKNLPNEPVKDLVINEIRWQKMTKSVDRMMIYMQ